MKGCRVRDEGCGMKGCRVRDEEMRVGDERM